MGRVPLPLLPDLEMREREALLHFMHARTRISVMRSSLADDSIGPFIKSGEINDLLRPWIGDDDDRAYVVRCMLGAGPAHHRGANYALLRLLGLLLQKVPAARAGAISASSPAKTRKVLIRMPPHLSGPDIEGEAYPLELPLEVLERLAPAGSQTLETIASSLTDGPPQHALANVAMVCLIGEVLARLETNGQVEEKP